MPKLYDTTTDDDGVKYIWVDLWCNNCNFTWEGWKVWTIGECPECPDCNVQECVVVDRG